MYSMKLLVSFLLVCNTVATFVGTPSRAPTTLRPTRLPTVVPSFAPSVKPTTAIPTNTGAPSFTPTEAILYVMTVQQSLDGITADEFNDDSANSDAFIATVAECLEDDEVVDEDISITSVSSAPSSAAHHGNLRVLDSKVYLTYEIVFNPLAMGFSNDSESAYNELLANLNGTTFNTNLQSQADSHDATELEAATANFVSSASYSLDVTTDSNDDGDISPEPNHKKRQTRYFEIGVIAGGGGFLILSVLSITILHYFTKPKDTVASSSTGTVASKPQTYEMVAEGEENKAHE